MNSGLAPTFLRVTEWVGACPFWYDQSLPAPRPPVFSFHEKDAAVSRAVSTRPPSPEPIPHPISAWPGRQNGCRPLKSFWVQTGEVIFLSPLILACTIGTDSHAHWWPHRAAVTLDTGAPRVVQLLGSIFPLHSQECGRSASMLRFTPSPWRTGMKYCPLQPLALAQILWSNYIPYPPPPFDCV